MLVAGRRRRVVRAAILLAGIVSATEWVVSARQDQPALPAAVSGVEVIHVHGNVYMLAGADGNSVVQVGDEGVLVVDTMTARQAPALRAAIRSISAKAIIRIIDTSVDPAHTGGNDVVAQAGRYVTNAQNARAAGFGMGAPILAHENVLAKMSAEAGKYKASSDLWPTESYYLRQKDLFVNDEPVQVFFQPAAYTDGDSLVLFRRSDVLATGDLFTPQRYPAVDLEQGGSINGVLAALNRILEIAVPGPNEEGGTMIVPGHGHLCDEADVSDYRDMVTIVRDRVQDAIKRHMTLNQVKAAGFTLDYDGVYATPAHPGTAFVETVYRSLSQPPEKRK